MSKETVAIHSIIFNEKYTTTRKIKDIFSLVSNLKKNKG